jgi:phage shock protein PspC (stress-responsive transcriptional regulator)
MNEPPRRRLTRSNDRMLAGVAGGIADYFDLDPVLIRLAWVVACFVGLGTGALAYLIFWIVMPERPQESGDAVGGVEGGQGTDASLLFGVLLVAGGALLLFGGLGMVQRGFALAFLSWPALLIAAGLALIFMRRSAAR